MPANIPQSDGTALIASTYHLTIKKPNDNTMFANIQAVRAAFRNSIDQSVRQ
jgi:hypothetical protein